MPVTIHHTPPTPAQQAAILAPDLWETEVVPSLPDTCALQATHLHALQRQRGLTCPATLLRALLAYVLCVGSFRQLGAWAVLLGLADLSDTAWRQRLRKASAWLLWLAADLLASPSAPPVLPAARRVLLVDATRVPQADRHGMHWRLHTAYEFLAGRLAQLRVTDHHTAEALPVYDVAAGDIVVADNAYGYRRSVAYAVEQQADVVLRITATTFPLATAEGQPLDVLPWLRKRGPAVRSQSVWCHWQRQPYRVRLLALKLSDAARRAAQRHKRRKARRDGRQITATTLELAGWVLLITTLDVSAWSDDDVVRLYRARWQVELVFKRMKQALGLQQVRARTAATAAAPVRAALVAWALQVEDAGYVRAQVAAVARDVGAAVGPLPVVVSSWAVTGLCVATLRQQVQGQWSWARVWACLPQFQRFLVQSPRRRAHLETELRAWLLTHAEVSGDSWVPHQKAA